MDAERTSANRFLSMTVCKSRQHLNMVIFNGYMSNHFASGNNVSQVRVRAKVRVKAWICFKCEKWQLSEDT